jgi:hypothetical protein
MAEAMPMVSVPCLTNPVPTEASAGMTRTD